MTPGTNSSMTVCISHQPSLKVLLGRVIQFANTGQYALSACVVLTMLECMLVSSAANTESGLFYKLIDCITSFHQMLFTLTRSSSLAVSRLSAQLLCVLMEETPLQKLPAVQDFARSDGHLLCHMKNAFESATQAHADMLSLLVDGNAASFSVISQALPRPLLTELKRPILEQQRRIIRRKADVPRGADRQKGNWMSLLSALHRDHDTCEMIWNSDTRSELLQTVAAEITAFDKAKVNTFVNPNTDMMTATL